METLWVIAAPSCVGKTTFIQDNTRIAEITGLKHAPYIEACKYKNHLPIKKTVYLHYCLNLNPIFHFKADIHLPMKVILLVADRKTMQQRAIKRKKMIEEGHALAHPPNRSHITPDIWERIYRLTFKNLDLMEVPVICVNTNLPHYPIITQEEVFSQLETT